MARAGVCSGCTLTSRMHSRILGDSMVRCPMVLSGNFGKGDSRILRKLKDSHAELLMSNKDLTDSEKKKPSSNKQTRMHLLVF